MAYVFNAVIQRRSFTGSFTDGFRSIYREEGLQGLYRGTSLALVGVSNGAIQFMGYEKMKAWGFEQKRKRFAKQGREFRPEDDKLVSDISVFRRDLTANGTP